MALNAVIGDVEQDRQTGVHIFVHSADIASSEESDSTTVVPQTQSWASRSGGSSECHA